jgi:hypothetical protein
MRDEKEILKMIEILENIRSTDVDIKRKVELQIDILKWVLGEPLGEGVITLADS